MFMKHIKNAALAVFAIAVTFFVVKDCTNDPTPGEVTHDIDTVYHEVKVEVPKYVPKWRTKIDTVEVKIEGENGEPIDTLSILKDYYAKYQVIDTLILNYPDSAKKTFGYGIITDIISKNAIVERSVIWNYKIPVVTHTITIHPKPKAQLYAGMTMNVNSVQILSSVSGALLYKTKNDHIYIANIGVANNGLGVQPFIGGGIAWKITLRKPKVTDLIK